MWHIVFLKKGFIFELQGSFVEHLMYATTPFFFKFHTNMGLWYHKTRIILKKSSFIIKYNKVDFHKFTYIF